MHRLERVDVQIDNHHLGHLGLGLREHVLLGLQEQRLEPGPFGGVADLHHEEQVVDHRQYLLSHTVLKSHCP